VSLVVGGVPHDGTDATGLNDCRLIDDEGIVVCAGRASRSAVDRRAFDLEVSEPECRQFGEQVIDAGDRGFGALEADSDHHRQPRELCGVLRERVVHCTFLGENGGQYQ
jgi:hypothetical protein